MNIANEHFAVIVLAGGIALFLMGMELLGEGLQRTAGARMRDFLGRMTCSPARGAAAGACASSLIHTGPTTVVVLGYVNAGILTLAQAIPVIFGANIGTTLSMQIVAFDIGAFCFAILAAGAMLRRFARRKGLRNAGLILVGFGLLFLGLETTKLAFEPLRDTGPVQSLLGLFSDRSVSGYLLVLIASVVVTAVFQSSGVIISLLFSMAALGVIEDFAVSIPFLLGAHIGSCGLTVMAAFGGGAATWRAAIVHVMFNVLGAVVATIMIPLYNLAIPLMTDDVTRQIANFNTLKQVIGVVLFLPFAPLFGRFAVMLTKRTSLPEQETSYLDPLLLERPESAILAVIRELRRQAGITRRMLMQSLDGMVSLNLRKFATIPVQEKAVDTIKRQTQTYIGRIARRQLIPRQARMLESLAIASSAIERIGDHVEDIGYLSREKVRRDIWFPDDDMNDLLLLSDLVCEIMETTLDGLEPEPDIASAHGERALELRRRFQAQARELKERVKSGSGEKRVNATTMLFFLRYVYILEKIVSHLKALARRERDDVWEVQTAGLQRVEPLAPKPSGKPPEYQVHETFKQALSEISPSPKT